MAHTNWAGNQVYQAVRLYSPQTVEEVQELVRDSSHLKVLGTRHSFSDIADTTGDHLSLQHMNRILSLDREKRKVTVEGGITYGHLSEELHREGCALHNLASLPHISVAGACATATHGSGDRNGCLATAVSSLELVTGTSERKRFSRERDDVFPGVVVSLGALGVVTQLTLDIQPTFAMNQYVYENLPFSQLEANLDAILSSAYSVSLFTDWRTGDFNQAWLKRRFQNGTSAEEEPDFFQATPAGIPLHPIAILAADPCTEQMGIPGPWQQRLPHFRMEHIPSVGEELQSEYIVPRTRALEALKAIREIKSEVAPLVQISEVRTIAADDLWMSPFYQQDSVAIHFTWVANWPAVHALLPTLEAQLTNSHARPHWGKLFTLSKERLQALYPKLSDFRDLLQACDPDRKFRNAFLEKYIYP